MTHVYDATFMMILREIESMTQWSFYNVKKQQFYWKIMFKALSSLSHAREWLFQSNVFLLFFPSRLLSSFFFLLSCSHCDVIFIAIVDFLTAQWSRTLAVFACCNAQPFIHKFTNRTAARSQSVSSNNSNTWREVKNFFFHTFLLHFIKKHSLIFKKILE